MKNDLPRVMFFEKAVNCQSTVSYILLMFITQIEEEAIQALEKLYEAVDNADENISVERLQQDHGVPLWVTEHKII